MLLFFSLSLSFGERITSFSLRLDLPSVVSFYVRIIHNSSLNDNMFMFVSLFSFVFLGLGLFGKGLRNLGWA